MTTQKLPLLARYQNELEELKSHMTSFLLTKVEPVNSIIETVFQRTGKMIRPALFFNSCALFNYNGSHYFPIAAVCEYIHVASLLHDDVIDKADVRRSIPTLNQLMGNEAAVLMGDLIYSTACRLMVATQSLPLIDAFAECIRAMSESELLQLSLLWKSDLSKEDYFQVIEGKTSVLLAASVSTPGHLSHQDGVLLDVLNEYGKHLGRIFQIVDDCFDYVSSQELIGKKTLSDLLEGKVTLPLILGLNSNREVAKELKNQIRKASQEDSDQLHSLKSIQSILLEEGFIDQAMHVAEESAQTCFELMSDKGWSHSPREPIEIFQRLPFELLERQQ